MITYRRAVEDLWPHVSSRLTAYLRSRGASRCDAEDLVQECAARVLTREVPFHDAEDLLRWCTTVARNAHIDLHRGLSRLTHELGDEPAARDDVHREVAARLDLLAVTTAWPLLSATDRSALASAVEQTPVPAARREAVRLYVQRNRARQRLQALLVVVAAAFLSLGRTVRRSLAPLAATTVAAAATMACLLHVPAPAIGAGAFVVSPATRTAQDELTVEHARRPALARSPSAPGTADEQPHQAPPPLTSITGPEAVTATIQPHSRPNSGQDPQLVCVGDLPLLPGTCLADPTGKAMP